MEEKQLQELNSFFKKNNKEIRKKKAIHNPDTIINLKTASSNASSSSKKKGSSPPKKYVLVTTPGQFALVDPVSKDEYEVQERIPTIDIYKTLDEYNEDQKRISSELLHLKYEYLFEYKPIGLYEGELETFIEPKEAEYQQIDDQKKRLQSFLKKNEDSKKEELEDILLSRAVFVTQLKELDSAVDTATKRDLMRNYITKEKECLQRNKSMTNILDVQRNMISRRQRQPQMGVAIKPGLNISVLEKGEEEKSQEPISLPVINLDENGTSSDPIAASVHRSDITKLQKGFDEKIEAVATPAPLINNTNDNNSVSTTKTISIPN